MQLLSVLELVMCLVMGLVMGLIIVLVKETAHLQGIVKMTRCTVPMSNFRQRRNLLRTSFKGVRTTWVKMAPGGWMHWRGDLTFDWMISFSL